MNIHHGSYGIPKDLGFPSSKLVHGCHLFPQSGFPISYKWSSRMPKARPAVVIHPQGREHNRIQRLESPSTLQLSPRIWRKARPIMRLWRLPSRRANSKGGLKLLHVKLLKLHANRMSGSGQSFRQAKCAYIVTWRQAVPEANRCRPFVRLFYAQPSTYVWHDSDGNAHTITQAEGREQGDPLMPALPINGPLNG